MKFRGKTVEELYFPWDVANGPGLEVELGHDLMPWEGYTWLVRLPILGRARQPRRTRPLGSGQHDPAACSPPCGANRQHHGADTADQDLGDDWSVESESGTTTRCVVDPATTLHIISERDAELAG